MIAAIFGVLIVACSAERAPTPAFHESKAPQSLSEWGMVYARDGALIVNDGVTPYDIATPLFSDYALKLRTIWLPNGEAAIYHDRDAFDFPVGTVVTKTFFYLKAGDLLAVGDAPTLSDKWIPLDAYRIIETRLLVRQEDGWAAYPYVWNDEQTDATLKRTGAILPVTLARGERKDEFSYLIPDQNQCAACHATNTETKAIKPIGLKARHLNKPSAYSPGFNQLDHWIASDLLTTPSIADAPANAIWADEGAAIEARARAYLDINCSHCHNPEGAADTSGLNLEPDASGAALGLCKPPIAAGGGTGGRAFGIVPGEPDSSITLFRMETMDPAAMMPELGRALAHEEGVALIRDWITRMSGGCG